MVPCVISEMVDNCCEDFVKSPLAYDEIFKGYFSKDARKRLVEQMRFAKRMAHYIKKKCSDRAYHDRELRWARAMKSFLAENTPLIQVKRNTARDFFNYVKKDGECELCRVYSYPFFRIL